MEEQDFCFKRQHNTIPTVSGKLVNFVAFETVKPQTMGKLLVKVHACVMTFAWMFCASIGIIVSRFYKPLWPHKRHCGRKVWFMIHRSLMLILGLLVTGAFVVIFLEVRGISEISFVDFHNIHPVLGIIVMALTIVQIFLGLFRPASASKNRPMFNWSHWGIGIILHMLSVVNIILGVRIKKMQIQYYVSYILYIYAAYQVLVVFVLEVVAYSSRIKERKQQTYSMYAAQNTTYSSTKDGSTDEPPGSFTRRVILRIHVVMVTILTGSVVVIIAIS
ncbi:putative ferric-chelate reductase 1 [Gigantopelta aegis]|uniref:putative ferric-chelate reductase 1 n=1 Tax=Gigantopelta aegis TaxID=1735272 RepID=UPI001B88872F|nr:putative ferric-chelate reductase 1 [Gigantopelta aegis]